MTPLAVAVERNDWRSVALYLLLGVAGAASALPPQSMAELLDLVGGTEDMEQGSGRGATGR